MTTKFLELATTLKYLGAKWLPEKKLILRPERWFFSSVSSDVLEAPAPAKGYTPKVKGEFHRLVHMQAAKTGVKLSQITARRLWRKTCEGKYDTRDKNLSTVLANSSNHSRARRHNLECK